MSDRKPDLNQLNRTFIGSVLFIDIVGYSMRSVQDQLEMKEVFNGFVADAVQNVAPTERIMVDTGDGAAIAFLGDPEDALFAALSLRDAIEAAALTIGEPGFVRMGINLGPLKIVRDINGHTNMIGDGVNDAQRVMSFAEPGQVMVSHAFYDIISRFTRDYAQLFIYEGTRHDKHVREHEVYRFGPASETGDLTARLRDRTRARSNDVAEPPAPRKQWKRPEMPAVPAPLRKAAQSRAGLVAAGVGALTVVGAVWSWTSTPQPPAQTAAASTSAPAAALAAAAPAAASAPPAAASAAKPAPKEEIIAMPAASAPAAGAAASVASAPADKDKTVADAAKTASAESSVPAAKPGVVKLAIEPWGEVYVNGGRRGVSPPMKSLKLPPGKHQIEIRNSAFAPYKQTVEVKSDAETTVRYVF